jgi:hypothetical protein
LLFAEDLSIVPEGVDLELVLDLEAGTVSTSQRINRGFHRLVLAAIPLLVGIAATIVTGSKLNFERVAFLEQHPKSSRTLRNGVSNCIITTSKRPRLL